MAKASADKKAKPDPAADIVRCPWVDLTKPDYVAYHDDEWGVPVHDDRALFEYLTLEAAQAGLSWYTVLKKRDGYRRAFSEFDPAKVARYTQVRIEKLMLDSGIVRNQMKIEAAVSNARAFLKVQEEFGSFDTYIWGFVKGKPIVNRPKTQADYQARTPLSDAISKDLRLRGFRFVGSTILYAHMQATGMVDDHSVDCFRKGKLGAGKRKARSEKV
jgi:DNA-3-methyladenine glycosylase I